MESITLSDREFAQFQDFIYRRAGISLSEAKKALVAGRLSKRLQALNLASFSAYFDLITGGGAPQELQMAIDLLTTNETYFFREPKHFEFLKQEVLPAFRSGRTCRIWSAACSSGEEPYSLAMLLADCLGGQTWEILASDISTRVLERARSGLYPLERTERIPPDYLKRFCLKGVGNHEGWLLVESGLRARVKFLQVNLIQNFPDLGEFDMVFLRNVMIYFDNDTKRRVVDRIARILKPKGLLIIGHSESLMGITNSVTMLRPSIYRRA